MNFISYLHLCSLMIRICLANRANPNEPPNLGAPNERGFIDERKKGIGKANIAKARLAF